MAKKSLLEILEIKNLGSDEEPIIKISTSRCGLPISYDLRRFEENPATYVAEQLSAHQEHYKLVREELLDFYGKLNDCFDRENDIERILQFVPEPEKAISTVNKLARLILAPLAWIQFKTLKGLYKEQIQNKKLYVQEYKCVKGIINYGKKFVEQAQIFQLYEPVSTNLEKWAKVLGDLSYLYSRLVATSNKEVQMRKREYKELFPNSEI